MSFTNIREEEKIGPKNYPDPRVKVGNWFQRQFKFRRHDLKKESGYSIDYKPINIDYQSIEDNAEYVANRVTESYGKPVKEIVDENYSCNYLTLYNINYNKVWTRLGQSDYLENVVNGVNYGLGEAKRQEWDEERNFKKDHYLTTSKKDFIEHKPAPVYPRRREQAQNADKTSVCRMFVDKMDFKTREDRICFCPSHPEICAVKPRNPANILP